MAQLTQGDGSQRNNQLGEASVSARDRISVAINGVSTEDRRRALEALRFSWTGTEITPELIANQEVVTEQKEIFNALCKICSSGVFPL